MDTGRTHVPVEWILVDAVRAVIVFRGAGLLRCRALVAARTLYVSLYRRKLGQMRAALALICAKSAFFDLTNSFEQSRYEKSQCLALLRVIRLVMQAPLNMFIEIAAIPRMRDADSEVTL